MDGVRRGDRQDLPRRTLGTDPRLRRGHGAGDAILNAGPEVSGSNAWEDVPMGLRAVKCKSGEYIIFSENSGFGAKNNMFRWTPQAK